WGVGAPIFSAIAERFGDRKAIVLGALVYALGLLLTAFAITPGQMQALEVLVGFGVAGTGFGVIIAIIGRATSMEHRSMALGIATAMGSVGQIIGPPVAAGLLSVFAWPTVFMIFAGAILIVLLMLPFLRAPANQNLASEPDEGMGTVLKRAFRDPSYTLIFIGFFSCGYQLGFVTAHFPAFVTEVCGPITPGGVLDTLGVSTTSALGAWSIALIGLTNIFGTIYAGKLGATLPKKYLLAGIYTLRTIAAGIFILLPMTPFTVIVFSAAFGALWLATVPLTSGLIAHIYGLRYMGTLYGFVFLSHQIGSFMGVWLGGALYDLHGSYTLVWWVGVGVGAFSAIVHLPVRENRVPVPA
ncbi:MAG: MFS transporter, partial [Pseudomonadota bacterium]